MTVTVARVPQPGAEWDAFVRRQAGWTHFHLSGWADVIRRTFHHECVYLAARETSGVLTGILPLVQVRSLVFGRYLVSMPFVNHGGPLGADDAVRALVDAAAKIAERGGAHLLELRSRIPLPVALTPSHRKVSVVMPLVPGAPDKVWAALPAKVRSQVRRPQKEGMEVRFGADQVAAFHAVYARNMRDLGTPAQPLHFYESLVDAFPDDAWVGCVYYRGVPAAAGFGFHWADEFEMTWASSVRDLNPLSPNMLLYWSFIERATTRDIARFNFGRCTPGAGTHRFKQQWGGIDQTLWWYQRSRRDGVAMPAPDQGKYSLGPRIWKHLPLPLATALGPRIVRGIP